MNQDFTKANRLLKKPEFQNTFDKGTKVSCHLFTLVGCQNSQNDLEARLGLMVSKKVGKANIRNRVKRHLREIFRANKIHFKGLNIIVIAKSFAANATLADLSIALQNSLSQLNLRFQKSRT